VGEEKKPGGGGRFTNELALCDVDNLESKSNCGGKGREEVNPMAEAKKRDVKRGPGICGKKEKKSVLKKLHLTVGFEREKGGESSAGGGKE